MLDFSVPLQRSFANALINSEKLPPLSWIRVSGYRFTDTSGITDALKSFAEKSSYFAAVLNKTADCRTELYLGTDKANPLPSLLPDCKYSDSVAPSGSYTNILTGDFENLSVDWDAFLRSPESGTICFIGKKPDPSLIQTQLSLFEDLRAVIDEQRELTLNTGNLSMKKYNARAEEALDRLLAAKQRLIDKASSSVFECAVLTSGNPESVISFFKSEGDRTFCKPIEPVGVFIDSIKFPESIDSSFRSHYPLYQNRCSFPLSSEEVGKLLPFPKEQHMGFNVVIPERSASDYLQFDINPFKVSEGANKIFIGNVIPTDEKIEVDISSLTQHALVTGASGSGKSTTLFSLIKQCSSCGVNSLILEPVKGEFQKLPDYGISAKVYSTGHSGISLFFNPLIPQNLTTVRDHISGLVEAITAQSDNESPIPEALTMLLTHCYEKAGFSTEEIYFSSSEKRVPTFDEVYEDIRPYFTSLKLYQGEVRTNIMSALTVRLNAIRNFRFLHGSSRLDIEKMLSQNSVVQFDGFSSTSDICFIGNIILQNINEYVRNSDPADTLKHLVIIDEAHNFFKKSIGDYQNSRTLSSENLSNMISELRAYGVGFIIADQRPSALSEAVVANTKLKICHACESGEDVSEFSVSMALTDYQTHLLHSLSAGEAIVSLRGDNSVLKAKMHKLKEMHIHRITMCKFCPIQPRCKYNDLLGIINDLPLDYYAGLFKKHIGNPEMRKNVINDISAEAGINSNHELLCITGHIVEYVEGIRYREYLNSEIKNIIIGGQNHG